MVVGGDGNGGVGGLAGPRSYVFTIGWDGSSLAAWSALPDMALGAIPSTEKRQSLTRINSKAR